MKGDSDIAPRPVSDRCETLHRLRRDEGFRAVPLKTYLTFPKVIRRRCRFVASRKPRPGLPLCSKGNAVAAEGMRHNRHDPCSASREDERMNRPEPSDEGSLLR